MSLPPTTVPIGSGVALSRAGIDEMCGLRRQNTGTTAVLPVLAGGCLKARLQVGILAQKPVYLSTVKVLLPRLGKTRKFQWKELLPFGTVYG